MVVNKKRIASLILGLSLLVVLNGCNSSSSPSSISGTLSVPLSGDQIYETSDFGQDSASAEEINYSATVYGNVKSTTDEDMFKFNAQNGDFVVIDIDAESEGSGLDSFLVLYDSGVSTIAENNDYPPGTSHDPANHSYTLDSHIEKTVSSSGTYYIRVKSNSNLSSGSYILRLFKSSLGASSMGSGGIISVGTTGFAGQSRGGFGGDFVPDEIIVQYKPGIDPQSMTATTAVSGYRITKSVNMGQGREVSLLKFDSQEKAFLSLASLRERTLSEVERLNALPSVEYAEPNYIFQPLFTPNDTYYIDRRQWHYPLIKLDQVWEGDLVNDVSSATVAVIDTGVARSNGTKTGSDHEDLGNFVDEYDFISDTSISLDGDGMDNDATDPGDDPAQISSSFHGTHVTGTIGAITNNSKGVAGVAGGDASIRGVRIMPLRALGAGGGTVYDIAQAVLYAAQLTNASGTLPTNKADVINMSLGATSDSATLKNAITAAYNAGVLIVASAGNDASSVPFYPAAYDQVVSVSAVGLGAERAPYSSYGGTIDIAAPGGDLSANLDMGTYVDGVLSTLVNQSGSTYTDTYVFYQGTSMAAPHVAGVAALIKAAQPSLNAAGIKGILLDSQNLIDIGTPGWDPYYGHGLVNAYSSVQDALVSAGPVLFPFPKTLRLEGSNPSGSFVLKNVGDTSGITINSIAETKDPDLIISIVTPSSGTADASGMTVTVELDTSSVEDGLTHKAVIEIVDSTGKKEYVYVIYNRDGFPEDPAFNENIGDVFVYAIDALTGLTAATDITTYSRNYAYTIENLKPGRYYYIRAKTDRDNDSNTDKCEPGEACGAYPTVASEGIVLLPSGKALTGINFNVAD